MQICASHMKHATLIHVASSKLFVRMLALELLAVQLGKPSEHWEICHPSMHVVTKNHLFSSTAMSVLRLQLCRSNDCDGNCAGTAFLQQHHQLMLQRSLNVSQNVSQAVSQCLGLQLKQCNRFQHILPDV